ncbi:DUF6542 domain-containing protein [Rhodococcus sp. NPDC078407]|uniref:DUF6542 domain-containing protein n=1 Tax=Rhodococcus sp. NPDC078407 TaxID=3364509 RepID=UPI0037CAB328
MSTSQRARSGVPLDHRSILATLPGVPAWGAVAIAAGLTFLGFLIDAARGTELTGAFAFLYVLGCIAGVVLVRYRGLFTAMVQAPLILFVAVPLSYQYFTDDAGTSLKDIILNVAIPLVNRFPLMLLGTVVAVGLGAVRIVLKRQNTHAPAVRRSPKRAEDKPTRAQRRVSEERPERSRRRVTPAVGRSVDADAEATDIVPGPYVGRRRTDPASGAQQSAARAGMDSTPRRAAAPIPSTQSRYAADSSRGEYARPDHQKPDQLEPDHEKPEYPRALYPQTRSQQPQSQQPQPQQAQSRRIQQPQSAESRYSTESSYSTEARRGRSAYGQPPRADADTYRTGSRPVGAPRTPSPADADQAPGNHALPTAHRDDIPPHPVPRVRYRDRHAD